MSTVSFMAHLFAQLFERLYSVNYMVTSVLYDQFRALNTDFHNAVGPGGQFHGSVREFRRRHQSLRQSVENADQFMTISNVAGFCCQIANLIMLLYGSLFFPEERVGRSPLMTFMNFYWPIPIVFCLTLTACQGIVINHVVCIAAYFITIDMLID